MDTIVTVQANVQTPTFVEVERKLFYKVVLEKMPEQTFPEQF